jgi:hypothetical protein
MLAIHLPCIAAMPAMPAMPAMSAVAPVAEHVEEWTREEEKERQNAEEMGAVFSDQEESGDRDETGERPPCSGSSSGVAHRRPLGRSGEWDGNGSGPLARGVERMDANRVDRALDIGFAASVGVELDVGSLCSWVHIRPQYAGNISKDFLDGMRGTAAASGVLQHHSRSLARHRGLAATLAAMWSIPS